MPGNLDGKYSIEVRTRAGELLADFAGKASNRKIDMVRNGAYSAEWSINVDTLEQFAREIKTDARSLFSEGQNQSVIKRVGVPIFGGQIEYSQGDLAEVKEHALRIPGWGELFTTRQTSISKTFTAGTDIGAAAWDAINDSQLLDNGSIGILQGTLQAAPVLLADTLLEFKNLKELLSQFSERVGGFDYEFTWDKRFNIYYPHMGVVRSELEFVYPGNVLNVKPSRDATTIINYAVGRGQGFGDTLITTSEDVPSQESYKRRETVLDFSDIPDIETLQALLDGRVAALKEPLEIVEVKVDGNQQPYIGSYNLGDYVKIKVLNSQLYGYVSGYYRIDEIHIEISEDDNEIVNLKLSK